MMNQVSWAALISSIMFLNTFPSKADIFTDMWRIATDPLKLDAASSTLSTSIERSLTQLQLMESTANTHVAQQLDQIRSITDSVIIGSQETITKANVAMLALEKKIDNDAINLIYRVQCAADVIIAQGRQAFADAVEDLGRSNPRVYFLGIKILDLRTKRIKIENPDQAYKSIKKSKHAQMVRYLTDSSKAYDILSYYANLENMAKYTLCFYKEQPASVVWVREISALERLSAPWASVALPTLDP